MIVVLAAYALAFALLMSQRLRRLAEKVFGLGPLARLLPLYRRLSDSVQVYRTHAGALVVAFGLGLATVAGNVRRQLSGGDDRRRRGAGRCGSLS